MEENNNKKVLVPTIIAVVTLVVLTVGATYAYFKVATDNNFGTPSISATTPSIGSVALSTGGNLTMNLTAEQMMKKDSNITYYASPSGTTTEVHTENIGTATVTGDGAYTCTYTLTIDDNANSLYDKFQTGYANKSAEQVVLTVNDQVYDFNTAGLFPKEIEGTMSGLTSEAPQYITAQLKLVNMSYKDQSYLAGQNITLTFGVEDFNCTADPVATTLCIRANNLHEEKCGFSGDSDYCGNLGSVDSYSYGNLGTKGSELQPGDALTCDVNGDGGYDEATERFYYVSDYYNTTTKEWETDKATLIYYDNTGTAAYYTAAKENWHGPVTAITKLPTTSEWKNVSLINPIRAILNHEGGNTVQPLLNYEEIDNDYENPNIELITETHNLPTAFDYSGYSARLVTYQEMKYALDNCDDKFACLAFGQNTRIEFWDNPEYYWTETPVASQDYHWWVDEEYNEAEWSYNYDGYEIKAVDGAVHGEVDIIYGYSYPQSNDVGVRPVIEVYKTDIDY